MLKLQRCLAALAMTMCGGVAVADDTRLQPDFTFKRVTAPKGNVGGRITVQIDPSAKSATINAPKSSAKMPKMPKPSGLEWFWTGISPDLEDSGPGRLEEATRALSGAPAGKSVPTPRLQTLREIASAHGINILRETVGTDVSPALVLALIAIESSGRASAESSAGALGLMQLMPDTAIRFGVTDRADPAENIKGGVAYLSWLMKKYNGDPILVLAGYNAGAGSVRDYKGVPPYPETRAYVPKVLAAFNVAKALCKTPPELVSDGCVFSAKSF